MENKVLARVNGKDITEKDMKLVIAKFSPQEQQQFYQEDTKKQLIDHLVSLELIYNDAVEKGIDKDEQYISELEVAKKEIMTKVMLSKLLSEVSVTDKEAEDYYNANKNTFTANDSVRARHILVDSKEKAEAVKTEIENGKSFELAAQEYSSCPTKDNGGDLGYFSRGQMVKPFEDASYSLDIGVLSDPVQTQFGFHIIKVEERNEGSIRPFVEVKEMIRSALLQERQNFKFANYTESLKSKSNIEIF